MRFRYAHVSSALRRALLKNRFEKLEKPDTVRIESTLAGARAFLSICSFFAIYIHPAEPVRLLFVHVLYSVGLVVFLASTKSVFAKLMPFAHSADVFWALLLSFFSRDSTSSPLFGLFIFAIVAAAYRWHLRETMVTTAILAVVLFAENRLLVQPAYLAVVGVLFGFLSGKEKLHRTVIALASHIGQSIRSEPGLTRAVHATIGSLLHVYDAAEVWFVIHRDAHMTFWRGSRINGENGEISMREHELPENVTTLLPRQPKFESSFVIRDEWTANIYVFEPSAAIPLNDGIRFLEASVDQIGPAIYSVFVGDLLRSRAGGLDRADLSGATKQRC